MAADGVDFVVAVGGVETRMSMDVSERVDNRLPCWRHLAATTISQMTIARQRIEPSRFGTIQDAIRKSR